MKIQYLITTLLIFIDLPTLLCLKHHSLQNVATEKRAQTQQDNDSDGIKIAPTQKKTQELSKKDDEDQDESQKQTEDESEDKQDQNESQDKSQEKQEDSDLSKQYDLAIKSENNQFYAPFQFNGKNYSMGFTTNDKIISWLFTSRSKKHQLCDQDNNCDQADTIIECKNDKQCKQEQNNHKQGNNVKGDKSVIIKYKNNGKSISDSFISAEKVKIGQGYDNIDDFIGIKSLANDIVIVKDNTIQFKQKIPKKNTIKVKDLNEEQKLISIKSNDQDSDQDSDSDQQNEQKNTFNKIKLSFQQKQLLSIPKNLHNNLIQTLKTKYLDNKCKLYSGKFKCTKSIQIDSSKTINLCITNKCFKINLDQLLQPDSTKSKKINLLFKIQQSNDIVFSPAISSVVQITLDKGQIVGLKFDVSQTLSTARNSDKTEQQDSQQQSQQQSQQDSQKQQKVAVKSNKINEQQNKQKSFSKGVLSSFIIYGGLALLILIIIKMKAKESFAASLIQNCLDATWYRFMDKYFKSAQGYNPTKYQQHDDQHIDHSDSVTVGYSEKQGKQLFWEKNSVQGI